MATNEATRFKSLPPGEKMVRTGVYLLRQQVAWLAAVDNQSAVIRAALDDYRRKHAPDTAQSAAEYDEAFAAMAAGPAEIDESI